MHASARSPRRIAPARHTVWVPRAKCRTRDQPCTLARCLRLLAAAARPSRCTASPCTAAPSIAPGFTHFPYVNPDAPKGGRLVLGALGTFDSLNPFIIKGVTPSGLREYVYESLMARSGDEPFTLYGLIAESVEVPRTAARSPSICAPRPASPTARRSRPRTCSSATPC